MNPNIIPDGLTLYYILAAPIGSHAAGETVILCEWHAAQHMAAARFNLTAPELPGHDDCVLCAEEREDEALTAPFGAPDDPELDEQRAEDERNYYRGIGHPQ